VCERGKPEVPEDIDRHRGRSLLLFYSHETRLGVPLTNINARRVGL
jgi:hypothetical protein